MIEVWAAHETALRAWLAVSGQWRTSAPGQGRIVWLGLDYTAARAGLDLAGLTLTPEIWVQVQAIEAAAREELNRHD